MPRETMMANESYDRRVGSRAKELLSERKQSVYCWTDHLFSKLMIAQYLVAIISAFWISPSAWNGAASTTHLHVWAAVVLGGIITSLPVALIALYPGTSLCRHTIAAAQMLMSALLIHLSGGRIETHFHVFGSLAFLAFYRDWKVLATAAVVVAADHFLRGMFWPQSVFGIVTAGSFRWLEHAAWVFFEVSFLVFACRQNLAEMTQDAMQRALLENTNELIEHEVQRRTAELEQLALHDALTGLPNRASTYKLIQTVIDCDKECCSALLFLDFDRFKWINDSLGHDVGDQLLQQIAARLRGAIRKTDELGSSTAARLGGDEFVILLDELSNPEDALVVADRLLAALAEPHTLVGRQVYATASIGVVANLQSYSSPGDALRDADTAMYEAKSAGKGRYILFDQTMHSTANERLRLEHELRSALANQEFFLEYQPIVSLESGQTVGFEALLRWNHPRRGRIMPSDFVAVAEETGLIVNIGAWAIDQACRECANWRRRFHGATQQQVHVNLSRRQLTTDLVETVRAALEKHGLSPNSLHLEVTETAVMENLAVALATLTALRELQVKIDMDDFGTGYSSLACLQELPIDILKIDRSFIEKMDCNRKCAAMVHAVTNLSRNLGLAAVAEGIETAEQLVMLRSIGCPLGQGYFFSRPMAADEVAEYLDRSELPPIERATCQVAELSAALETLEWACS